MDLAELREDRRKTLKVRFSSSSREWVQNSFTAIVGCSGLGCLKAQVRVIGKRRSPT